MSKLRRLRRQFRNPRFWLIVLIFGVIVWAFSQPRQTGPADGHSFDGKPATRPTTNSLRIGTFNIDGGQGTDGVVDLDRTARSLQHLDFVALQEVHGYLLEKPSNEAQELSTKLHLAYLWAPSERRWMHDTFGNADFTDLPVKEWHRVVLPNATMHALRNYELVDADWNGVTVHFLTTHVDFKNGGDEQLQIVIQKFLQLPTPAVLMGDLNHTDKSEQIQKLLKTPGVEEAVNSVLEPKDSRVDWIFVRGLKTEDAGEVDTGASDHPAYWAQVRLP
jgi:endonuclease/exonuclease/phosphatase family metal-dependent hydrolase